jgi:hypothetical protein
MAPMLIPDVIRVLYLVQKLLWGEAHGHNTIDVLSLENKRRDLTITEKVTVHLSALPPIVQILSAVRYFVKFLT